VAFFMPPADYQLVALANGAPTLYSARYGEKLHPGLGPAAEADLLYVRQLQICRRLLAAAGEFVIWDVGLGAAANALAVLRATRELPGRLRLLSFDDTSEPLAFAQTHAAELGYLAGYEEQVARLLADRQVTFANGNMHVTWQFCLGDFPAWIEQRAASPNGLESSPHAVFFDAFSPAKNPAMWTLPVLANLFRSLPPGRPCALTTYTRSTLVRAALLLAGFYVGTGQASGRKEETTIAANCRDLVAGPLDARWLLRAARSDSAEPLREPVYTRSPIRPETLAQLRQHPQFAAK